MVSARVWLWLVIVVVVVPMFSLALAMRMPVRWADRWAEAVFSALECVAWLACEVTSRLPESDELLFPEAEELPAPPPKPMGPMLKLRPAPALPLLVEKLLEPCAASLKAWWKVAEVDVSALAVCCCD